MLQRFTGDKFSRRCFQTTGRFPCESFSFSNTIHLGTHLHPALPSVECQDLACGMESVSRSSTCLSGNCYDIRKQSIVFPLRKKNNTANNIQAISKRTSNSAKTIREKNKPSISKILPVNDGVIISRNSLSDLLSYSSNHE